MTPERVRQIEDLYHAAREDRAVLAKADPDLRREVESLFAQDSSKPGTLDRPAWEGAAGLTNVDATITPGTQLGPYKIEGPLGAGGMGEVFRALDTKLNRPVAIKFISRELADTADLRRFQREAQMASSLNHPHIVTVYDAGEFDGRQYLVTEYVDGGTLNDWAKEHKRTWKQIVELLTGVADGLAAAHQAGMVHRDVKPANILVARNGYAKLADFGLARLTEAAAVDVTRTLTQARTTPGMIIGTIAYMSPEQASGLPLDARSDIFSFGVVLYEMLAGKRPFRGATDLEVLKTIAHGAPEPLGEELSVSLRMIVEKALEKDPAERYQSMRDMVVDLKRQTRQTTELPAPERSNRPLKWLAAVFLALAAGLAAWKVWPTLTPATVASPQIRSIAVLPLENLSGDPKEDYIAEGATEELIANLGQVHAFEKVISRTSVARYKETTKSMPQIGRELGVDAIVEGSVQRSAGRTRVRTQLILASTDRQLWSRAYDREGGDLLGVQAEVARAIALEIRAQVTPQESARLARSSKINSAAQEAYLLGRYHSDRYNEDDLRQAVEQFEKAIQLQPDYAPAYAGLANAWQKRGMFGTIGFHNADAPAHQAARKALDLDGSLAAAHSAQGELLMVYDWDWAGAEKEIRRAVELDPNSLESRGTLGDLMTVLGRFPEALEQRERTVALDPLSAPAQSSYGRTLYRARRYDEAIPHLRRAIELDPRAGVNSARLADVFEKTGKLQEAILIRHQAVERSPDNSYYLSSLARAYALAGNYREARTWLAKANRAKVPNAASIALAYFALGEKDRGFEWLTKAVDDRAFVMFWKIDPTFDSVRSDRRFQALVARLKIPD
jgi:serine/threonine protein kinase/tetratricopeptide (TPR) repeat protein